jgi:hypothetical protein
VTAIRQAGFPCASWRTSILHSPHREGCAAITADLPGFVVLRHHWKAIERAIILASVVRARLTGQQRRGKFEVL